MAKGPIDIGEENMALNQEDMASNQETTEPNRQPRDRKAAETEAARLKGQETRRRNYEKRMEKQRLAALAAEEQRLKQRKRDEGFMREALRQAKKAAAIGDVPIGCVIVCGD
ncbi:MAG: nucleoside deaminase, partial [Enterocloster clostridioformis]|nr:nucleoside deaminase [Enterocloster clostridioformis]